MHIVTLLRGATATRSSLAVAVTVAVAVAVQPASPSMHSVINDTPEWLKADELVNSIEELWLEVFAHALHHQLANICSSNAVRMWPQDSCIL